MRVVIAEDSVLLREGLRQLLAIAGHEVVASVGASDDLLAAVHDHEPDISIVDIRMPPTFTDEGLRAALALRAERSDRRVLVLSQFVVYKYAADLIASGDGGIGYLLKDGVGQVADFLDSLQRIADGGEVVDPHVVRQLLQHQRNQKPLARLTEREAEVLALMAEGRANAAIARQLVVSDATVAKHVNNIFSKFDLAHAEDANKRVLAVLRYLRGYS